MQFQDGEPKRIRLFPVLVCLVSFRVGSVRLSSRFVSFRFVLMQFVASWFAALRSVHSRYVSRRFGVIPSCFVPLRALWEGLWAVGGAQGPLGGRGVVDHKTAQLPAAKMSEQGSQRM